MDFPSDFGFIPATKADDGDPMKDLDPKLLRQARARKR